MPGARASITPAAKRQSLPPAYQVRGPAAIAEDDYPSAAQENVSPVTNLKQRSRDFHQKNDELDPLRQIDKDLPRYMDKQASRPLAAAAVAKKKRSRHVLLRLPTRSLFMCCCCCCR
jgi:hypothetical protein